MAVDYDAPRKDQEEEHEKDTLHELTTQGDAKASTKIDAEDDAEDADAFELPGADLSDEELTVRVLPRQPDEFTCSHCFLVHHHSQLAYEDNGRPVCSECAA